MQKNLLKSFAALVLALSSTTTVLADNTVYGLTKDMMGSYSTASLDLDAVNASGETTVTNGFNLQGLVEYSGFHGGVTVGNKYYAFVTLLDDDENEVNALVTINFETGKITVVNNYSYGYGQPGYNVQGMTYDKNNNIVYVTENGRDESNKYVTVIYTLNLENGNLTKVGNLDQLYATIASNNAGGFYAVKINGESSPVSPCLYKIGEDLTSSLLVDNKSVSVYTDNYSLIVSDNGSDVKLTANKSVLSFDPANGTVKNEGSISANLNGATFDKGTEDGTPMSPEPVAKKSTRFLTKIERFGDSMGSIKENEVATREYYYYNTNGDLVGSSVLGRGYSGAYADDESKVFSPKEITKGVFDENGNLTGKYNYQWGLFDYDDNTWKKSPSYVTYTYNDQNQLIADTTAIEINEYAYDAKGRLTTKTTYAKASKGLIQKISYYDFDKLGNPLHYISDGDDYNKYEADLEYDENGNKTEEFRYTVTEDKESDIPGMTKQTPKERETWKYEGDALIEYNSYKYNEEGNEVPNKKTVYTPLDGNMNILTAADSIYYSEVDGGTWFMDTNPVRYYYGDFADMADNTAMELVSATSDPKSLNTVNLTFSMPALAGLQDCQFVIYRNCLPVDTVSIQTLAENADPETGLLTYQDKAVKNGTYSYFIQPLFNSIEVGPTPLDLDEPTTGDDNVEWTGYYTSNPLDVTVNTELPAVTELALIGGSKENMGIGIAQDWKYTADLSWKNPVDAEKYGFIKNAVYLSDGALPVADKLTAADEKASVELYKDLQAYVVTSYTLGKAVSESIDLKIADIDKLIETGINTVATEGGVKVTFDGNNVSLSDNANVAVFTTAGQKVYDAQNVNSVSLDTLSAGVYVVTVEKNGKVNAYKYSVK